MGPSELTETPHGIRLTKTFHTKFLFTTQIVTSSIKEQHVGLTFFQSGFDILGSAPLKHFIEVR